jgi:hypothetical protein
MLREEVVVTRRVAFKEDGSRKANLNDVSSTTVEVELTSEKRNG